MTSIFEGHIPSPLHLGPWTNPPATHLLSIYLVSLYLTIYPSLPKPSKYLSKRCLEPLKAFPNKVFGCPNACSQGIWKTTDNGVWIGNLISGSSFLQQHNYSKYKLFLQGIMSCSQIPLMWCICLYKASLVFLAAPFQHSSMKWAIQLLKKIHPGRWTAGTRRIRFPGKGKSSAPRPIIFRFDSLILWGVFQSVAGLLLGEGGYLETGRTYMKGLKAPKSNGWVPQTGRWFVVDGFLLFLFWGGIFRFHVSHWGCKLVSQLHCWVRNPCCNCFIWEYEIQSKL